VRSITRLGRSLKLSKHWHLSSLLLALALTVSACGASTTPTALPAAAELLSKAASEVRSAKSIKIKIQLSGAPSFVDPPASPGGFGNTISFVSADGLYVAPDKVSASVVARILGISGRVDVIAIGDDQWMKNEILTAGKWQKRIFSPGFNAARLVSSNEGIERALKALYEVSVVGRENVYGTEMYHIKGKANGADMASLTVGLIRGSVVEVDVYIATATGRADRIRIVQPDTVTEKEPKPTTWDVELFDYNVPGQISAPTAVEAATAPATPSQATPEAAATP
jgi:hypothetical protein